MTSIPIYQLPTGFFVEEKVDSLGSYMKYSDYEIQGKHVIDLRVMDAYDPHPPHKIPLDMWDQMVSLFMYYVGQHTEVQARFYVRDSEFICIIPKQKVTGGSVDYDYTQPLIDIDGNYYTAEWLAENGFYLFGHFHLHPFDMPNPSGQDDKNELDTPALFGIVSLPPKRASNEYRIKTTVVANNGDRNRRYDVNPWDFIELDSQSFIQTYEDSWFSSDVLDQVTKVTYAAPLPYNANKTLAPFHYVKREENLALQGLIKAAFETILLENSDITTSDIVLEMYSAVAAIRKQEEAYTFYDYGDYLEEYR